VPELGSARPYRNRFAIALTAWWSAFGAISVYWALGGGWLLDTAIQSQGLALAKQRPMWLTMLVLFTAFIKFGFAWFGYLIMRRKHCKLPRWLYGLFGLTAGLALCVYGLVFSVPGIPYVLTGDMTTYRWMRLLVWMPQFWVGGIVMLLATWNYWRHESRMAS